jgi:hypothetical protein
MDSRPFLIALAFCSNALAAPAVYDVRYEFTTAATFGPQIKVSGMARYSAKQADQLPADQHAGRYNLISHSVTVEGVRADGIASTFEVMNDAGYGAPPPWTDSFSFGSRFSPVTFSNGLTLTEVRVFGVDDSGTALSSDRIFVIGAGWDFQGMVRYIGANGEVAAFAFELDSLKVCRSTDRRC